MKQNAKNTLNLKTCYWYFKLLASAREGFFGFSDAESQTLLIITGD